MDCSADFRLRDPAAYERWYGEPHPAPEWLGRFVYGLPEIHREAIREAHYVSGVGCNATAVNLALLPLVRAGLIDPARRVIAEVKVGSSEGGNEASGASHHPERSGVSPLLRAGRPPPHGRGASRRRAGADVICRSRVELVRGALATCHAFLARTADASATCGGHLSRRPTAASRSCGSSTSAAASYRHPEPKILAGSNYADVGWAVDDNRAASSPSPRSTT